MFYIIRNHKKTNQYISIMDSIFNIYIKLLGHFEVILNSGKYAKCGTFVIEWWEHKLS